jgi:putative membrane protein
MKKTSMALGIVLALAVANGSFAQQNSAMTNSGTTGMVGTESKAEFDRLNKKGAADVAAIRPSSAKLSSADQSLMMEVAKGGMKQLEMSKVAVQKATNEAVRQLAQAEVQEQTGLSAKLKEIAQAKGVTLPSAPDAETQAAVSRLQAASGMAFDRMYVTESGVKGHEKLDTVMGKVESSAADANLKSVAQVAHPLVKNHLKVSRDIMTKLSNGSAGSR